MIIQRASAGRNPKASASNHVKALSMKATTKDEREFLTALLRVQLRGGTILITHADGAKPFAMEFDAAAEMLPPRG